MDRISVAIRIRPLNQREESAGTSWLWDDRTVTQCALTGRPVANASFAFDQVFGPETTNAIVFQKVARDLVNSAMNGINATIFAYGQTSSGKTHTMKGSAEAPGVIPLSVQALFQCIEQAPGREFLLRVAYMEIYNEEITDLLNPASGRLALRVDPQKGAYVEAREQIVTCPEELLKAMDMGERNRHVGATNMNEHSSRSHTIFRVTIESRERIACTGMQSASVGPQSDAGPVKVASLHLVDLAGSERIRHTGAEGERRKEGAAINKSLLNLGLVMQKLSEGKGDREHVPYRNSKLTHILSSALGGNSRTAIVCNITPATLHADESTSTLKFASTAKLIKTRPQVNEVVDEQTLLRTYKRRLQQLEKELAEASQRTTVPASAVSASADLVARLKEEEAKRAELQEKLERLANQFVSANSINATSKAKQGASKSRGNRRETWAPARGADEEEPEADHTPVVPTRITAESLALPSHVAAFSMPLYPNSNSSIPNDLSLLVPTAPAQPLRNNSNGTGRSSNGGKSKRSVEDLEEEIRALQRDFDHALEQLETALSDLDEEKKRPQAERDQLTEEVRRLMAEKEEATSMLANEQAASDRRLEELQFELELAARAAADMCTREGVKDEEIVALKEKLNNAEMTVDKLKWDAEMSVSSTSSSSNAARQTYEEETKRVGDELVATAVQRAESAEAALAELRTHLEDVREEKKEMQARHEAEMEAKRMELETTTALLDTANAESAELTERLAEAEKREQVARQEAEAQRTKHRRSEGGDSAARRQVLQLQREAEENEQRVEQASRRAAEAEAERDAAKARAKAEGESAEADVERARQRAAMTERRAAEEREALVAARIKSESAAMEREEALRDEVRKASGEVLRQAQAVDALRAVTEAEASKARMVEEELVKEGALRRAEAEQVAQLRSMVSAMREEAQRKAESKASEMHNGNNRRATMLVRPPERNAASSTVPTVSGADRDVERLRAKVEMAEAKAKQALADRAEAQSEKGVIERELKEVKKKSAALEMQLERTKGAESKIKELSTALTTAQKKMEAATKEAEAQAKSCDKARAVQAQAEAELALRSEEAAALRAALQTQQEDGARKSEEIARLQSELVRACKERDDLLKRRADLDRALSAAHTECANVTCARDEAERGRAAEAEEKRRLCEDLTSISYGAEQAVMAAKSEQSRSASRMAMLEAQVQEVQGQLRAGLHHKEALEEQIRAKEAQVAQQSERAHVAEQARIETEARLRETESRRANAERDVLAAVNERKMIEAALQAELSSVQREARAVATDAERRVKESAQQMSQVNAARKVAEEEREAMQQRAEALADDNARLSQEKGVLAAQRRAADEERQSAVLSCEARGKDIAALSQELRAAAQSKERLNASLDSMMATNESERDQWQHQKKQLESECAALKEKARLAQRHAEEVNTQRGNSERERSSKQTALQDELKHAEARLQTERKSAEAEMHSLHVAEREREAELKALRGEVQKLSRALRDAEAKGATVQEALTMAEELSAKLGERDKHVAQLERAQQKQTHEWAAMKSSMEAKLTDYKTCIAALEEEAAANGEVANDLVQARAEAEAHMEEVTELKLRLAEVESKAADANRRAKARQSIGSSLPPTIAPAPTPTPETKEKVEVLKVLLKETAEMHGKLKAGVEHQTRERSALKSTIADLTTRLEDTRVNLETLPQAAATVRPSRSAMKRDINEINRREREEREKENAASNRTSGI